LALLPARPADLAGCFGITFFTLDGQAVTTFSNMFVDDLFADLLKLALYPAVAMVPGLQPRATSAARNLDRASSMCWCCSPRWA
jgi:hypothetical protein